MVGGSGPRLLLLRTELDKLCNHLRQGFKMAASPLNRFPLRPVSFPAPQTMMGIEHLFHPNTNTSLALDCESCFLTMADQVSLADGDVFDGLVDFSADEDADLTPSGEQCPSKSSCSDSVATAMQLPQGGVTADRPSPDDDKLSNTPDDMDGFLTVRRQDNWLEGYWIKQPVTDLETGVVMFVQGEGLNETKSMITC